MNAACTATSKIVQVQDNLSIDISASLYESFSARRDSRFGGRRGGTLHLGTAVGWIWPTQSSSVLSNPDRCIRDLQPMRWRRY
jgi:hypothetical protein